jgi:hypothetical protein
MALRAPIAACLLSVIVGTGASCGAKDVVSPESVADAAQATIEAGGSRIALTGSFEADGKKLGFTGTGVQNTKGSLGEVELDIARGVTLPKGVTPEDLHFQEVFAHNVVYMRSPALERGLSGGKHWTKLDLQALQRGLGTDQLSQLSQTNPADMLSNLRGVGDVTEQGKEAVRGVECTHYSGTIDLRKLPSRLPPSKRARAQQGIERLIKLQGGDSTQDFDVWIDKRKLVRRLSERQSLELEPGKKADFVTTAEFFDFGATAVVRVPARDQVEDVTRESISEIRKRTG